MYDLMGTAKGTHGLTLYYHTKRVMECAALSQSRELAKEGVIVNVIGGGSPAATSMTNVIACSDLPVFLRCIYLCFACFTHRDDGGSSAKMCAKPCVWGAMASAEELGNGKYYLDGKVSSTKLPATQLMVVNQQKVMALVNNLIKE